MADTLQKNGRTLLPLMWLFFYCIAHTCSFSFIIFCHDTADSVHSLISAFITDAFMFASAKCRSQDAACRAQTHVLSVDCGWFHWNSGCVTGFLNNMSPILGSIFLLNSLLTSTTEERVTHLLTASFHPRHWRRDQCLSCPFSVILDKLPSVAVCVSAICTGLMWVTGGKCSNQCLLMVSLSV